MPQQTKNKPRRVGGRPQLPPFVPPEAHVGDIVNYQDGFFNRANPYHPALVTEVGPQALSLAIIAPDALNLRVLENAVRHRDDPEGVRLSALAAEEGSGYGVWWHRDGALAHDEVRSLRLLLGIYRDELEQAKRAVAEQQPVDDSDDDDEG